MHRVFVPPDRLSSARTILEGEDHHHLSRVLRARAGDRVLVFDGQGAEIDAEIAAIGPRTTELILRERRLAAAPPAVRLTLLQGLARGEKMDFIIQKTCELGVARVIPVLTERAVAPPAQASVRQQRWEKIAREAARQCGRADVPTIDAPVTFTQAVRDAATDDLRLVLWESAQGKPLRGLLPASPRPTTLLIGPEGGFSRQEITEAEAAGFATVGLGPRILRVETAAVVAVALLQFAAGGLD